MRVAHGRTSGSVAWAGGERVLQTGGLGKEGTEIGGGDRHCVGGQTALPVGKFELNAGVFSWHRIGRGQR